MYGFVYLLKTDSQPFYKIGQTSGNIAERIASVQTGCPYRVKYIFHIRIKNQHETERYLHQKYAQYKVRGEWFKFDDEVFEKCLETMQRIEFQVCLERCRDDKNNQDQINTGYVECNYPVDCVKKTTVSKSLATSKILIAEEDEPYSLDKWYKWLPTKKAVLLMIEELDPSYNLAYVVKNRLKKTEGFYNRRAKAAIVRLLLDTERNDLIKKLDIDPSLYPFPD